MSAGEIQEHKRTKVCQEQQRKRRSEPWRHMDKTWAGIKSSFPLEEERSTRHKSSTSGERAERMQYTRMMLYRMPVHTVIVIFDGYTHCLSKYQFDSFLLFFCVYIFTCMVSFHGVSYVTTSLLQTKLNETNE